MRFQKDVTILKEVTSYLLTKKNNLTPLLFDLDRY